MIGNEAQNTPPTRSDNKTGEAVIAAIKSLAEADTRIKQVYLSVLAYTVPTLVGLAALLIAGVLLGLILRVFWWALGFGG